MTSIFIVDKVKNIARECIKPLFDFANNRQQRRGKAEIIHTSPIVVEGSFIIKNGLIKLKP